MRGPFLTGRYASPGSSTLGVAGPRHPDSRRGGKQLPGLRCASGCLWWGRGLCLRVGSGMVVVQGCSLALLLQITGGQREALVQWSP